MKTGSYQTIGAAPGRIGISVGSPRGQPAGYRMYRALAPTRDMLDLAKPEYERRFAQILAKLDPKKVAAELQVLAGGAEPILLCFEKPPFNERNWCHRRLVADWLERELGIVVPEVGFEQAALPI